MSEARATAQILDDATVSRVRRAFRDELESMWLYEQQFDSWRKLSERTRFGSTGATTYATR